RRSCRALAGRHSRRSPRATEQASRSSRAKRRRPSSASASACVRRPAAMRPRRPRPSSTRSCAPPSRRSTARTSSAWTRPAESTTTRSSKPCCIPLDRRGRPRRGYTACRHEGGFTMLESRLKRELRGDVRFDPFTRGRYATDASIYQIEPLGVVVPRDAEDALRALEIAADLSVPILPRGAGSSQCGQTVGEALVIDHSRHLDRILELDVERRTVRVEPGIVLDRLNAALKPHGLWFPVDVSTSAQATLGGMAGNNSCGARSLRYGNMVHNVLAAEAWLPTGEVLRFGEVGADEALGASDGGTHGSRHADLVATVRRLYAREKDEIAARVPKVQRRVAGYNLDMASDTGAFNMAHLLVGSEGTLAWLSSLELKLAP